MPAKQAVFMDPPSATRTLRASPGISENTIAYVRSQSRIYTLGK
jgi:hypothetical protein